LLGEHEEGEDDAVYSGEGEGGERQMMGRARTTSGESEARSRAAFSSELDTTPAVTDNEGDHDGQLPSHLPRQLHLHGDEHEGDFHDDNEGFYDYDHPASFGDIRRKKSTKRKYLIFQECRRKIVYSMDE